MARELKPRHAATLQYLEEHIDDGATPQMIKARLESLGIFPTNIGNVVSETRHIGRRLGRLSDIVNRECGHSAEGQRITWYFLIHRAAPNAADSGNPLEAL